MKQIVIEVPDGVQVRVINTTIPAKQKQRVIDDLHKGEIAYTTPWALAEFRFGKLGIHKNYPADPQPGGTVSTKIQRQGDVILVEKDTVRKDYISHWDKEQCLVARYVNEIQPLTDEVTIIFS